VSLRRCSVTHLACWLARNASVDGKELYKSLRSYLALARAAQGDFGRGSYWFLNVAKARLVIHVSHKIKGHFRDNEVSGLIAAMTDTAYNAAAQRSPQFSALSSVTAETCNTSPVRNSDSSMVTPFYLPLPMNVCFHVSP
jgi:hypothetical protein